jgi:protein tyrosine phosphatase (PTP) superfamily phosphohydrolase (DUF442 family)
MAVGLAVGLYIAYNQAHFNFGTIQPGKIFRSGQMPPTALARALKDYHIKTVLNLRGSDPKQPFYQGERATTLAAGATQVDIAMSSCIWMSREQLRTLVHAIENAEHPLLIHCAWGAERTGLASAFAELLRPGATLADARAQFSMQYLFVRIGDGKVMAEHLDQYEAWLNARGLTHSPANFHQWADSGFKPLSPGREEWPHGDPYPLVVISRPMAAQAASSRSAGGQF